MNQFKFYLPYNSNHRGFLEARSNIGSFTPSPEILSKSLIIKGIPLKYTYKYIMHIIDKVEGVLCDVLKIIFYKENNRMYGFKYRVAFLIFKSEKLCKRYEFKLGILFNRRNDMLFINTGLVSIFWFILMISPMICFLLVRHLDNFINMAF